MNTYILDDQGKPQLEPDTLKWAQWYESADRHIGLDKIESDDEKIEVSTVFLGVDQKFGANGDPVLWETMIFGGLHDQYQDRYTSREAAIRGHQHALRLAKAALRRM